MEKLKYLKIIKAFAKKLQSETKCQVIVLPSEVKSEKFHIELTLLPHPVFIGNGRARIRMRANLFAEIPPSNEAINDCLEKSINVGWYFDEVQNFTIDEDKKIYGLCYAQNIQDEDALFADIVEPRSYSYSENWLVELEFTLEDIWD